MTAFHDIRLPARLAFGCTGGVERRTQVTTLGSGFERRSSPWAQGRRRYLIGTAVRPLDDAAELVAFFETRRGRLHGFRFRDPADCKSCAPSATPAAGDQVIGIGDGVRKTFALCKTYGTGDTAVVRPIAKPVSGTVKAAVNGAVLSGLAYGVNTATGLVTLSAAPAVGAVVTAGFEFDTPVRFDSDRIDLTLESFNAARVGAVALVEVRI